jgi:alkanesulfonate monooxygenase SsuD/methylene tetrahydromethanopterin reductase-like flavin-dependent oxidoreductase (luciferase family)
VAFRNERYEIFPAEIGPKPAGRIPVLLGGRSEKALDQVAGRADGWLPSLGTPQEVATSMARVREKAAGYGRKADELRCVMAVPSLT